MRGSLRRVGWLALLAAAAAGTACSNGPTEQEVRAGAGGSASANPPLSEVTSTTTLLVIPPQGPEQVPAIPPTTIGSTTATGKTSVPKPKPATPVTAEPTATTLPAS